jgi:hypothetical protein
MSDNCNTIANLTGPQKQGKNSRDGVFVNPNANQKTVDGAVFGTKILWFARSSTGALKKPWLSLSKTYFQAISSSRRYKPTHP